jgi:hypothetical protein
MSSCELKYVALLTYTKQGQWFTQLLRDMRRNKYIGPDINMVHMLGNNMGAIALMKSPHLNGQSKHIDICCHFVHDLARNRRLQVSYVLTADMVADRMTKPLQRIAFERFKNQLGIVSR